MTCYKSHLVVLKENKSISRDSDLEKLISTYTEQIPSIDEVITAHDVMKTAMARTVVRVGHILLKKQAILLPSVHNIFMSHARDLLKVKHIGCEEIEHVSSRWVLSDLTANLQHHIAYSCKVRKYGTLIYRPNADLVSLLSEAMWKLQNAETVPDEKTEVTDSTDSSTTDSLDDLNKLIHTQISTYLAKDSHSPFEHDELNFDNIIEQIHPKLWNAICLLTRSTSERRGTSKVTDPQSIAYHTKRARRLFLLCTILFCTDDRCSMPLHTLLTDTVESQGGSALLVQILNRLGICASADTLSRFIQYKVTKGDKPDLKSDTFTVISADNIDFMHSFARVYCGHQTSSWHGTTVQAAQPLPSLSLPDTVVSSLAGMCIDPLPPSVDLTCSSVDPSHISLLATSQHPSQTGSLTTLPSVDPSHVSLLATSQHPSQTGSLTTLPSVDPSHVNLLATSQHSSQTGSLTTLPSVDPSHVSLLETSQHPSQTGSLTIHHTTSVVSHKRRERSSPIPSPMKLTRSPLPKIQRRLRTGTEQQKQQTKLPIPELAHNPTSFNSSLTLDHFLMSDSETEAMQDLHKDVNAYILHRAAIDNSTAPKPFLNIQDYFSLTRATHTERSQIVYLEVMDAVADSKDTVMQLLHDLQQQFIVGKNMKWLVLEGDAKLYEVVKSLQFEYGEEMSWVIPYPGDWHMLMNYQSALMKAYYDAGLKALAKAAGYPLAAIQSSSQFKRSHNFILEAWEAIYKVMLKCHMEARDTEISTRPSLLEDIASNLQSLSETDVPCEFNKTLLTLAATTGNYFNNFRSFIQMLARTDDTWRFWTQFVFQDAMAYIGLFLAIRSGDWQLRVASMKSMAAVFTAFDHPNYQKLISQHLVDLHTMPAPILTMFQQGAFVVSILGRPWHSVAIDESHEMLINKDCKTSIVRPLPDYINRIAHYIPYRSKAVKNLQSQLFPTKTDKYTAVSSPFSGKPNDIKYNENVKAQVQALEASKLLIITGTNRGLINPFTNKKASAGQHHDLLNFRAIGQQEFLLRISSVILKNPSVQAPNRRRRLQTFSERKVTKSRITQLEKDRKLIMAAMKRKIQFSHRIGTPIDKPGEQLIELPLAISDNVGNPMKGQKSYTTKSLESRYKSANPQVFLTNLPWRPQCTLLEGMFLINTNPLGSHKTLGDYAKFLMTRFLLPQFKRGSREVHVLFDNPGRLENTPKYFEHMRRDASAKLVDDHCCDAFTKTTKVPRKWREGLLNCRECKRSLVKFLTNYFLHNIHTHLQINEALYVAGGFDGILTETAWFVQANGQRQPHPAYSCNAEETDTKDMAACKTDRVRENSLTIPRYRCISYWNGIREHT